MSVADMLRRARDRIATPETWCQKYTALDADGHFTDPDGPKAVRFCARGALEAVGCCILAEGETEAEDGNDMDLAEWSFLSEEAKRSGTYGSIEDFNDHVTHADVLRLFDRAIERAEASS